MILQHYPQHSTVTAEFCPKRRDDLKPGLDAFIGQRRRFRCLWTIEDGETSNYDGQQAFGDRDPDGIPRWVPTEDLANIMEDNDE